MKPANLKAFKIGYGDEKVAFYPRMATDAEMEIVNQQLMNVADDDGKDKRIFEIKREAIAEWSGEMPKKVVKEKTETKFEDLVENPESASDALKRYFSDPTAENEKVIRTAYNAFVNLMQPEVDFL